MYLNKNFSGVWEGGGGVVVVKFKSLINCTLSMPVKVVYFMVVKCSFSWSCGKPTLISSPEVLSYLAPLCEGFSIETRKFLNP